MTGLRDGLDGVKIEILRFGDSLILVKNAVLYQRLHVVEPMRFHIWRELLKHTQFSKVLINELFSSNFLTLVILELFEMRRHNGAIFSTVDTVVVDVHERAEESRTYCCKTSGLESNFCGENVLQLSQLIEIPCSSHKFINTRIPHVYLNSSSCFGRYVDFSLNDNH
jgi:hypothetical protein